MKTTLGLIWLTCLMGTTSPGQLPPPTGARSQLEHQAVRTLTDATYDEAMRQTTGLAMVWFHDNGTAVNESELLTTLGEQTNRFQFFRVNREENPVLWERILSGELSPPVCQYRVFRGQRRLVNPPVLVMLAFGGREVAEFECQADIPADRVYQMLASWIRHDTASLERRLRGEKQHMSTAIAADAVVPFFCEALALVRRPEFLEIPGNGYLRECSDLWRCLERYEPAADLAPAVPFLAWHVGGRFGGRASTVLQRIGPAGKPAVDSLLAVIAELVRQVDEKPEVKGAEWDERRVLLKRATAAAYALGGIGPEAQAAVPLLTRIAESEYGRMAAGGASGRVAYAKYGWSGSFALQCAISLNRIQPPPKPGQDAGEYFGRTLRVWSEGPEPAGMQDVAIVFWNGRLCYETASGTDGAYSIRLPPGRYLMQHSDYLPNPEGDFEILQEPEVVEVAKARKVKRNFAAETIFVDYW